MVNATVDNDPVSIMLDAGQSTTVPSNETWRVSIHLASSLQSQMTIDGIGVFLAKETAESTNGHFLDVTLVGGQTITEVADTPDAAIFITGFVVDS